MIIGQLQLGSAWNRGHVLVYSVRYHWFTQKLNLPIASFLSCEIDRLSSILVSRYVSLINSSLSLLSKHFSFFINIRLAAYRSTRIPSKPDDMSWSVDMWARRDATVTIGELSSKDPAVSDLPAFSEFHVSLPGFDTYLLDEDLDDIEEFRKEGDHGNMQQQLV